MRVRLLVSLLALGVALATGCGPPPAGVSTFKVEGSGAALDLLSGFQVTVMTQPVPVICSQVIQKCLNQSLFYSPANLVKLTGTDGAAHDALFVPKALDASGSQSLTLRGIPPGANYAIVVEALTTGAPPQFLGSFCGIQDHIARGANTASFDATLTLLATPNPCHPTIP